MNASKTLVTALVGAAALVVAVLFGVLIAGVLDDDRETITTVIPQAQAGPSQPDQQAADGGQASGQTGVGTVPIASDAADEPLTEAELQRAGRAALEIVGGGTVTEVDRSDDLGEAYEVEVLTDGGEVDIALDARFGRVPNLRYDD